jgi:protein-S-isoprenylcysteine O-methyltransferase Ste14
LNRGIAAAGTFLFFWLAPAMVAGYVPWAITSWHVRAPLLETEAVRWVGAVLIVAGAATVIECFARFAMKGRGTPAPVAPTQYLVVSGLYRHVRNPMYVGVIAAVAGQALMLGDVRLIVYGGVLWLAFTAFLMLVEEPMLADRFGGEYARYRAGVGRWWPRLRPWTGAATR